MTGKSSENTAPADALVRFGAMGDFVYEPPALFTNCEQKGTSSFLPSSYSF